MGWIRRVPDVRINIAVVLRLPTLRWEHIAPVVVHVAVLDRNHADIVALAVAPKVLKSTLFVVAEYSFTPLYMVLHWLWGPDPRLEFVLSVLGYICIYKLEPELSSDIYCAASFIFHQANNPFDKLYGVALSEPVSMDCIRIFWPDAD